MRKVLFLLMALFSLGAVAQTKIVVLSDPHVMAPGLLVNDVNVRYYDPTAAMGQQRKTATDALAITNSTTAIGTAGNETWYYVSGTVTNDNRIEVSGTVNLILEDGCNFTVSKGIRVASGNALNIYAQSVANRGSLTAGNYALPNYAAIGGNGGEDGYGTNATDGEDSGAITIYGGNITTTNGNIGGGDGGNGSAYNEHFENYDEEGTPTDSWEEYHAGNGGTGGSGNVTIYSGYITVSGTIGGGSAGTGQDATLGDETGRDGYNGGGTVNLSWTNTEDRIYADNYYGTVTLQKDFNGFAKGEVSNNDVINRATLIYAGTYYIVTIGSMPEGVTATADLELNAGFKNAVEGQVVTIGFNGVPAGKVPVISVTYGADNYKVFNIIDNGDGTFSFEMPAGNVTVTASELKKDIKSCTAEVPNQELSGYSYIYYKFEAANSPSNGVEIKEAVKDSETTLTLGTDYKFGSVYYSDMTGYNAPDKVGDKCLVEINGIGDYAGTIYVPFTIIGAEVSETTWGDLTWSLSNGALNIRLTTPANGNKPMPETALEGYPWYPFGSYITSITIGDGVLNVAANAFGGTQNVNPYAGVTSVSLPASLTSIGEKAFAYCGASFNLDNIISQIGISNIGTNAFNQVAKLVGTLSNADDNTAKLSLLATAQKADVTLDDRALTKNDEWNTLCLPFSLSAAQIAASPLTGATIKELNIAADGTSLSNTGELTLVFKNATSIVAGMPYIVKWTSGESISNPEFSDVDVADEAPTEVTSYDGNVKFVGQYSPFDIDADNINSILYIASGNKIGYSSKARTLKNFRAHFWVKPQESASAKIIIDWGDGKTTAIEEVDSEQLAVDGWYTLTGVKLQGKPTEKGVYINNGKKVAVK